MRFIILAVPVCLVAVIAGGDPSPPALKQAPAANARKEATPAQKPNQEEEFIQTGIGPLAEIEGRVRPKQAQVDRRADIIKSAKIPLWNGKQDSDEYPNEDPLPVRVQLPNKSAVEWPVENAVYNQSATLPGKFSNPQVMPGKVRWHASFEDACKASQKSHKPVLLFHLMGNLDQQFC